PVAPGPPRGAPEPRVSNTVTSAVSANTTSTSTRYATSLPLSPSAGALADLAVSAGRVGWARPGTVPVLRLAVPWCAVVPLPFAPVRVGGDPVAGAAAARAPAAADQRRSEDRLVSLSRAAISAEQRARRGCCRRESAEQSEREQREGSRQAMLSHLSL